MLHCINLNSCSIRGIPRTLVLFCPLRLRRRSRDGWTCCRCATGTDHFLPFYHFESFLGLPFLGFLGRFRIDLMLDVEGQDLSQHFVGDGSMFAQHPLQFGKGPGILQYLLNVIVLDF